MAIRIFHVNAKGTSFYKNLDKIKLGDELEMKWGIKDFPRAIQLLKDDNILGYIPKSTAEKMFKMRDEFKRKYKCFVECFNFHDNKKAGFNVRVEVK